MKKNKVFFILALALITISISAQSNSLESGMGEVNSRVRNIGSTAAGLIGAIIGLIALGRAAWKFSQGDPDSVMSLLMAIIAIILAQIAAGYFGK